MGTSKVHKLASQQAFPDWGSPGQWTFRIVHDAGQIVPEPWGSEEIKWQHKDVTGKRELGGESKNKIR